MYLVHPREKSVMSGPTGGSGQEGVGSLLQTDALNGYSKEGEIRLGSGGCRSTLVGIRIQASRGWGGVPRTWVLLGSFWGGGRGWTKLEGAPLDLGSKDNNSRSKVDKRSSRRDGNSRGRRMWEGFPGPELLEVMQKSQG